MTDPNLSHKEIVGRSISSAANSLIFRTITAVLKFGRSVLLARILMPADFGLVGLAVVYVQFLDTLGTFGLNMQLIRQKQLDNDNVSTHFWLRMGLQTIMLVVAFALFPVFQFVYPNRPQFSPVLIALAFIWYIDALFSIQMAVLTHQLNFKRINLLDFIGAAMSTVVGPILAWLGWGIWSLVIGVYFINSFTFFIGLWFYRMPWRPSWKFDWATAKENLRFGWVIVLGKQLNYGLDQFDDFWAGTVLGNQALGFYNKAFQFARYPRQVIADPLNSVFFATYSKFQNNRAMLSRSFFVSNSFILRLTGFFSLVLFVIAPEFIGKLLGELWLPMVFTFRLMLIYSFLDPLILTCGNLVIAVGRPDLQTKNRLLQLFVFIPLVIGFAHFFDIDGIAVAADLMLLVGIIGLLRVSKQFVNFSLVKMFLPPTLGLLLGGVFGIFVPLWLELSDFWLSLLMKVSISSSLYLAVLVVLELKAYRKMANEMKSILPQPYSKLITKFFGE